MEMTIKERITRFCEKYPDPQQCKIILKWSRKDGLHSQEVGAGNPLYLWRTRMVSRTVGKPLYIQHYRYDDETELMECAYSVMDCRTPKPGEVRLWKYAERYFVTNEDVYDENGYRCVYDINGNTGRYVIHNSYGDNIYTDARYFMQCFVRLHAMMECFNKSFIAMSEGSPALPPRYRSDSYYPWVLTEWVRYKRTAPKSKPSTTAARIEKLAQTKLDDEPCMQRIMRYDNSKFYYRSRIRAYFDKTNMVFRIFHIYDNSASEKYRVYISNKKFLFARQEKGKWVPNGSFTHKQFNAPIVNIEDVYNMPYCDYLRKFDYKDVYTIVSIMRNPEIEQLCNMGFNRLAKLFVTKYGDTIKSNLKNRLGNPRKGSKNICNRYRLTKKQLEVLNETVDWNINQIKCMLSISDLSSIDVDSFKKYVKCTQNPYYLTNIQNMPSEQREKIFKRLANINYTHPEALQLFSDTYYNARRYGIDPISFRNYDELVRLHDEVTALRNAEIAERRRLNAMKEEERNKELENKMAKIDKERVKLNYEDDEYIIRIPNTLSEIVKEGSNLHHCVSNYTDSHAQGNTTILFLRKKSAPDKSFYTIELTKGNAIQQIHGFGNRWIGNDPDAIPTVIRWLRKNNIRCNQSILTSTATGYANIGSYIEMPVVDGRKGI